MTKGVARFATLEKGERMFMLVKVYDFVMLQRKRHMDINLPGKEFFHFRYVMVEVNSSSFQNLKQFDDHL